MIKMDKVLVEFTGQNLNKKKTQKERMEFVPYSMTSINSDSEFKFSFLFCRHISVILPNERQVGKKTVRRFLSICN